MWRTTLTDRYNQVTELPSRQIPQQPTPQAGLDGASEKPEYEYNELFGLRTKLSNLKARLTGRSKRQQSISERCRSLSQPSVGLPVDDVEDTSEEESLIDRIDGLERRIQQQQTDIQPVKVLFDRAQRQPSSFDRRQILEWESQLRQHQKKARKAFEALWRAEDKLDKLQARQRRESQQVTACQRTPSQAVSYDDSQRDYQRRRSQSAARGDYQDAEMVNAQSPLQSEDEDEPRLFTLPRNHHSTRRAAPRCARSSVSEASQRRGSQQTDHDPSTQVFEDVFNAIRQRHLFELDRGISPLNAAPLFNHAEWHAGTYQQASNPFNSSPYAFPFPSGGPAHAHDHTFPSGSGSYYQRTFGEPEPPTYHMPTPQPPPYNALLAEEARRIFLAYDVQWNSLSLSDPKIPYPARALRAESLDDRSSIWALDLPPVDRWSRDDVAKANVQTFFLGVVDLAPAYHENAGRLTMGFDGSEASHRQVARLVEVLKKEKIRWHSDRLGRRNGELLGMNEVLQNDFYARTVFHAVCELMQVGLDWLEEDGRVSSDAI